MARQFVVERELAVPVERAWDAMVELIGDALTRVGGEHAFSLDDWHLLERTTEIHGPTRRVYRIVEGAPARSYVGRTEFVPAGGGCLLRWTVVAEPDTGTGDAGDAGDGDAGDAFDAFFARAEVAITRGADHIVGLTAPGARP
jgi:hypothetical protein